jgi:FMN phosphatase YigB (HAD superfamily)
MTAHAARGISAQPLHTMPCQAAHLKALLFDLDGTLYPLRPVRIAVLRNLIVSHLPRITSAFRTMRALAAYRRSQDLLRRAEFSSIALRDAQLRTASQLCNLPVEFVARCVSDWMEEGPLKVLPRYVRTDLVRVLQFAKKSGIRTAVCSDYPAGPKIAALGLTEWFDLIASAQDPEVGEFKPSPKILQFALERLGVSPEQALYIGDRPEVDGAAAKRAGIAFHVVPGRQDLCRFMLAETAGYQMVPSAARLS